MKTYFVINRSLFFQSVLTVNSIICLKYRYRQLPRTVQRHKDNFRCSVLNEILFNWNALKDISWCCNCRAGLYYSILIATMLHHKILSTFYTDNLKTCQPVTKSLSILFHIYFCYIFYLLRTLRLKLF